MNVTKIEEYEQLNEKSEKDQKALVRLRYINQ